MKKFALYVAAALAVSFAAIFMTRYQPEFIEIQGEWEITKGKKYNLTIVTLNSAKFENVFFYIRCAQLLPREKPSNTIWVSNGGRDIFETSKESFKQVVELEFSNGLKFKEAFPRAKELSLPAPKRSVEISGDTASGLLRALARSGYIDATIDGKTVRFFTSKSIERFLMSEWSCNA